MLYSKLRYCIEIIWGLFFFLVWKIEKLLPRNKNIWIFSSWFGDQYSDSTKRLYEYVKQSDKSIRCVWLLKNRNLINELRQNGIEAYFSYSIKSFILILRAKNIFSISGYEFPLHFINGSNFYELWHGMPLKKILLDDDSEIQKYKSNLGHLGRIRNKICRWKNFVDYSNLYTITNSDFFIPYLKTAFGIDESKILKTGLPRCDNMFSSEKENIINKIRLDYPDCKILLYMPTFRTSSWTGIPFDPFATEFGFDKFFKDSLVNLLTTNSSGS